MDPSRVAELLFASSSSAVDHDVLSYLATFSLEDDEDADHDQALADIEEICSSACPPFASLPPDERRRRVVAFLTAEHASSSSPSENPDPADASASAAASALAAALKNLSSSCAEDKRSDDEKEAEEAEEEEEAEAEQDAAAVDALAGLVVASAGVGAGGEHAVDARLFAEHALRERCDGDADAAGEYLLSLSEGPGGLTAAFADWRRQQRARKEEAERERTARERERQATLDRFAWRPEGAGGGGGGGGSGGSYGGGGKPPPPEVLGGGGKKTAAIGGGDKGSKGASRTIRFLEGLPVAVGRNEKYVVVSEKEEWDGGSRGKVKTKGKRGVGFA